MDLRLWDLDMAHPSVNSKMMRGQIPLPSSRAPNTGVNWRSAITAAAETVAGSRSGAVMLTLWSERCRCGLPIACRVTDHPSPACGFPRRQGATTRCLGDKHGEFGRRWGGMLSPGHRVVGHCRRDAPSPGMQDL
jgi:hypothetical protein